MPIVNIQWFAGRKRETKEKIAEIIEHAMVEQAGCKPGDTHVIFHDHPKSEWAINGKLKE